MKHRMLFIIEDNTPEALQGLEPLFVIYGPGNPDDPPDTPFYVRDLEDPDTFGPIDLEVIRRCALATTVAVAVSEYSVEAKLMSSSTSSD